MDYQSLSKEQLIDMIEELKMLNHQLLEEKEQEIGLDFSWTGNLGHWYWNIKTNNVTFNPLKITTLGYSKEEIPQKVSYQFFTDKLHPEDYQKTMDAMLEHLYGKAPVYEVEYRIRTKDGKYKWYYDRGKITKWDESGKPLFLAGIVFDITEKKEMQIALEINNQLLAEQSSTDGLTRIKNHRALIEHLQKEIYHTTQADEPLSIAIFDLDDFKKVNDTKGHIYGDKVLFDTAQIIQKNIRANDMVGRYGGEEFLVIFSETNAETAKTICERIRNKIETYDFGNEIRITISGGVQEFVGGNVGEFIHQADIHLYEAKKQGKNKII